MKRFMDELVAGNVTIEDLDDYIDAWHENPSNLHLHTFLGLSWDDWGVVATNPSALRYVVQARKAGVETGFPAIIGCACGKDHMQVPTDTEYDEETGKEFTYELVCRIHRKHEPCRPCMSDRRAETLVQRTP